MSFFESLAVSLGIQAAAMVVPGQNHFLLLSMLSEGVRTRLMAVLGIASAGIVFSTGAALSLWWGGQAANEGYFSVINLVGAAYLLFIGSGMIKAFRTCAPEKKMIGRSSVNQMRADARVPAGAWRSYMAGFLVNLSNPKSALFFGSIFATTLPISEMTLFGFMLVVVTFFFNSVAVHFSVVSIFSIRSIRVVILDYDRHIRLGAGVLFVAFGLMSATLAMRNIF